MALSHELISQFAKVVNNTNNKKTSSEATVYGTVMTDGNGNKYVKLDGSDQLTPLADENRPDVDATTANAKEGDRVSVLIKNHTATVTGNVSSPAANNSDIETAIQKYDIVVAEKIQANEGYIKSLIADEATIGNLTASGISVTELIATAAEIEDLIAGKVTVTDLIAKKIDADVVIADTAIVEKLQADNIDVLSLIADKATITDLIANNADLDSVEAKNAYLKFANIDFSNIGEAAIEKLFSDSGIIASLVMSDGKVTGELVGVTIKGDLIEAGTLKADRLVIRGSDGNYYKLNTNFNELAGVTPVEEDSIHGSVLVKKSIVAEHIAVDDLVAFGATIGGFNITNESIYSGSKSSAGNTTRGVYMDRDGQFAVGDNNNFIKFYKDTNGAYKLAISADMLTFGAEKKTVEEAINDIEIGGRNLLRYTEDLPVTYDLETGISTYGDSTGRINASGVVVSVDNVFPEEHELAVTVSSRNLLNMEKCTANAATPFGLTIEKQGDVVRVYGTLTSGGQWSSFIVLYSDQAELAGKGYSVRAFDVATNRLHTELNVYGFRTEGENVVAVTLTKSGLNVGSVIDYSFYMAVCETAADSYTPYMTDFSGITLTRCGKNLFKANWLEDYLLPGEIVEFEGRRCYKTKVNADNHFRVNGANYATIWFPFPIHQFSVDAYSASPNGSFGLINSSGTVIAYRSVASGDIANWRVTHTFTADVYGISFYAHPGTEDQTIYIDLDSAYVSTSPTAEEPEPYVGDDYMVNTDGTVEGVASLSPNMTLFSDNAGVVIDCTYVAGILMFEDTDEGTKYIVPEGGEHGMAIPLAYDDVIQNGDKLTLSFDYRSDISDPGSLYLLQHTELNMLIDDCPALVVSETDWQHYTHTFTCNSANEISCYALLLFNHASSVTAGQWIEIKNQSLKLEKGSKPTDWTPAPEDVSASITDVALELAQSTGNIQASLNALEQDTNDKIQSVSDDMEIILSKVDAQITTDGVTLQIEKVLSDGVNKVKTTTGYTFDDDGFMVDISESDTKTQITDNGMIITDKTINKEVLTANSNGVNARNLHATTYLIVGENSRFENYGLHRTGCFWIGG